MREMTNHMQLRYALFVHGAGGGGWEWNIWVRVFAAHGWHCAAPDLQPAHAGLAATTFEDYVDQVAAEAHAASATLGTSRDGDIVLIGASLGGLLVLAACARVAPSALVLINPLPPSGLAASHDEKFSEIVPWGSRRSLASTRRALAESDAAARLFAFRRWRDESGQVMRTARAGVDVGKPACPVLVIASESDDDVPLASSRRLAESFAASFRLLAGAGHVAPLLGRDAAVCASEVLMWLDRAPLQRPIPTWRNAYE